jgi:hypothetical protein
MKRVSLTSLLMGQACALALLGSCAAPPPGPQPVAATAFATETTEVAQEQQTATPPEPTRTPLPPPISPEFPTGLFYHTHPNGTHCVFQFNEDGTYAFYWMTSSLRLGGTMPSETGTYAIDGTTYTVMSTDLSWCPPPAKYAWTYDGESLAFQVIGEDACSDRQKTYESSLLYTRLK